MLFFFSSLSTSSPTLLSLSKTLSLRTLILTKPTSRFLSTMSINLNSHAFAGNPIKSKTPKPSDPFSSISALQTLKSLLLGHTHEPSSPNLKVLPFRKGRPLAHSGSGVDSEPNWHLGWFGLGDFRLLLENSEINFSEDSFIYLGSKSDDDVVYWAIDVSDVDSLVSELGTRQFCFVELRTLMVATDWSDARAMAELSVAGHINAPIEYNKAKSICEKDYTNDFTTSEIFKTRNEMTKWISEVGKQNGLVIVIKTSDMGGIRGRKPRITFGCERGGYYRITAKKTYGDSRKRGRITGTKKCGCPFSLKGKKLSNDDEWCLKVVCGVHNHDAACYLEGHSYAGRLSIEETSLLIDMSKSLVRPKEILTTLKQRDELNVTTMKTIYNVRQRYRVVEKAGRSQMQQLLGNLSKHQYIEWHRACEDTDIVKDLFWTHPTSVDLLRTFPKVLIMDCTYKTNRYRLPLLEIVGVTSTNLTFCVAVAYLEYEREDNYIWALSHLRSLLDGCEMPGVIVTDRELALMKAIQRVFPNCRHLLCRWHISRNLMAKCKKLFESKEKWDKFIMSWGVLVLCSTEDEYMKHLENLQREFSTYHQVITYMKESWLTPYKERFVAAWTDTCMHFGNLTSNRAETSHAKLKRQLGSSQGSFESCWSQIHSLLELQHTDIKASFEKSVIIVQHQFKQSEFKQLRGFISQTALELIHAQSNRANSVGVDSTACGCIIRHTYGLPCAHEIAEYRRDFRPIPLESVDSHWRKLSILPSYVSSEPTLDLTCEPELKLISKQFKELDTSTQLQVLKKLREIACPQSTSLLEPEVKAKTRGRPKEKCDTSTRRLPSSFEMVASQDSHSPLASSRATQKRRSKEKARALLEWHNLARFCGHCGEKTVPKEAGRRKQCSNESCKKRVYPRVDPVVIMLVIDRENDRALLSRQSRFVPRMWSCLAGFIEPGESLEEAVRRETWEETGIEVEEVVYHSSQPWPVGPKSMPCQLMVGFFAYAKSLEINVDKEELEDAQWHSREDVKKALTFAEYKKAQITTAAKVDQMCKGVERGQSLSADFNVESGELATMFIPGPFAIAHHLISSWVYQGEINKGVEAQSKQPTTGSLSNL